VALAHGEQTGQTDWRIVSMNVWEQDFVDEEEAAYIEIGKIEQAESHFGDVHDRMNCRLTTRSD
jgi:hypothetical protein